MATLTTQPATAIGGKTITYTAASAGGDKVAPGPNVYLLVKNGSAAAITVTLDTTGTAFNGVAIPDTAVTVAAGAETIIPITADYRNTTDGLAAITYSAVTTVTVAALTF